MKAALLEQERSQLRKTVERLQHDLAQRHEITEKYDGLVKERDVLESLLLSTQLENERCEEELKNWKAYARDLEKKVESYEGPHWQENPGVPSTPMTVKVRKAGGLPNPSTQLWSRTTPLAPLQNTKVKRASKSSLAAANDPEDRWMDGDEYYMEDLQSEPSQKDLNDFSFPFTDQRASGTNAHKRRSSSFWEYEEQVVPALANAVKKEERRKSLLALNGASVRKMSVEVSVVADEGDRYDMAESPAMESNAGTTSGFAVDSPAALDQPSQLADLVAQFELKSGSVLASFRETIQQVQQDGENKEAWRRKQQLDRAEALQQISDMADDVKQHVANLQEEADERELRLRDMLKAALEQTERYTAPKIPET